MAILVTFGGHLEPQGRFYHDRTFLGAILVTFGVPFGPCSAGFFFRLWSTDWGPLQIFCRYLAATNAPDDNIVACVRMFVALYQTLPTLPGC